MKVCVYTDYKAENGRVNAFNAVYYIYY